MNIKQLSVLLLAVSMVATQSISPVAVEERGKPEEKTKVSKQLTAKQVVPAKKQMGTVKDVKAKPVIAKKKTATAKVKSAPKKVVKPAPKKVVKRPPVKRAKKSRGKIVKKENKLMTEPIAKLGKFDARGSIKSFTGAANNIIEFMHEKGSSATASQKAEIFTVIARFNWIAGRKNFDTPAHYAQAEKLLNEASKHEALFGATKMKFINKWKASILTRQKKEVAKAPIKKATQKPVVKAVEKRRAEMPKKTATRAK